MTWGLIGSWQRNEKIREWFCSSRLLHPLFLATPKPLTASPSPSPLQYLCICTSQICKPLFNAYPRFLLLNVVDWTEEMQFSDASQFGAVSTFFYVSSHRDGGVSFTPPSMKVSYSYIIFCCSERVTVAGLGLPNKVDRWWANKPTLFPSWAAPIVDLCRVNDIIAVSLV